MADAAENAPTVVDTPVGDGKKNNPMAALLRKKAKKDAEAKAKVTSLPNPPAQPRGTPQAALRRLAKSRESSPARARPAAAVPVSDGISPVSPVAGGEEEGVVPPPRMRAIERGKEEESPTLDYSGDLPDRLPEVYKTRPATQEQKNAEFNNKAQAAGEIRRCAALEKRKAVAAKQAATAAKKEKDEERAMDDAKCHKAREMGDRWDPDLL